MVGEEGMRSGEEGRERRGRKGGSEISRTWAYVQKRVNK